MSWLTSFWKGGTSSGKVVAKMPSATAVDVWEWLADRETLLIDIRETEEHVKGAIPDSVSVPLSRYPENLDTGVSAKRVVFYCQSGARTNIAAARLESSTALPAFVLADGLNGWKRSFPT